MAACVLSLVAGTGAAAGSAQQRLTASPIYSGFSLVARERPSVSQCRGYVVTKGRYTGRSTSPDRRLQGTATLTARLATSAQRRDGFATGQFTVRDARGRLRAKATLRAVITKGTEVNGILTGRLMRPNALLLANVSLFFNPGYTFTGVSLGLNSGPNSAVAYSRLRNCQARAGARP